MIALQFLQVTRKKLLVSASKLGEVTIESFMAEVLALVLVKSA